MLPLSLRGSFLREPNHDKEKLNLTYREVFDRAGLSFNENTALFVFVDHKYILDDLIEEQFLDDFMLYDDFDSFIHECYEADILLKYFLLKTLITN